MKKVIIFYGSNEAFEKITPSSYRNLSDVAMQLDDAGKVTRMIHDIPGQEKIEPPKTKKLRIKDFVISADEYSSVQEHVIINFTDFIGKLSVTNMYIQNPPLNVSQQIKRLFERDGIIDTQYQEYNGVDVKLIRKMNDEYSSRIIGQDQVKNNLLKALYPLVDDKQEKPVVVLLYGNSGLGKTETAQYIAELLEGKLFRKQFSMYQNGEFANYLFGGRYNEKSFAKDLLGRDSNVILLDEFDKANPIFHSAFYQLFDEGVYEDQNYKVNVKHGIIICTSNYLSIDEVKEKLGAPIYHRFDAVIKFDNLSDAAKTQIAAEYLKTISENVPSELDEDRLFMLVKKLSNAREIKHLIRDSISLIEIRKICETNHILCERE